MKGLLSTHLRALVALLLLVLIGMPLWATNVSSQGLSSQITNESITAHFSASSVTIYVKADATGANDGTSWADAYADLQDALSGATAGDEIWVAAGTYKPTNGSARAATFQLKSGVAIYGGFAASEASREERNWEANATILSGDLNGNDDDGGSSSRSDNSSHVVTSNGVDSSGILDGFTITGGYAWYGALHGGGLYNLDGTPTIRHLIFSGNEAIGYGGGMYNLSDGLILNHITFIDNDAHLGGGLYNSGSGVILEDALFTSNLAYNEGHGGGVYNTGANITVENVTFDDNAASEHGGGMFNNAPAIMNNISFLNNTAGYGGGLHHGQQNSLLIGLTFIGNSSYEGGGMYNLGASVLTGAIFKGNSASQGGGLHNRGSPTIANAIFSGNRANSGGGIYHREAGITLSQATFSGNGGNGSTISYGAAYLTVTNSIFWNNSSTGPAQFDGASGSRTVSYSLVQGGLAGTGNIDSAPLFAGPINPADAPTTAGNFHLQSTSPAIDAGDNSAVPPDTTDLDGDGNTSEAIPLDLDGNARFWDSPLPDTGNGTPPIVDMGPYENSPASPVILSGSVTFQGHPAPPSPRLSVPLRVSLTRIGEDTPTYEFTPTTDENGHFYVTDIEAGTYEVRVKQAHTLQNMQTVSLEPGTNTIDFGTLREGDANDDNFVTILDFSILAATFGRCEGTDGYDERADFNEDGCVTILDFSLLASNFGQSGHALRASGREGAAAGHDKGASGRTSDVALLIEPARTSVEPEESFNVTIRLDAASQQVDGAQIQLDFDPELLAVEEVVTGETLELELANQFDNQKGTIQFAAGTLEGFPVGSIELLEVQFSYSNSHITVNSPPNPHRPAYAVRDGAGLRDYVSITQSALNCH